MIISVTASGWCCAALRCVASAQRRRRKRRLHSDRYGKPRPTHSRFNCLCDSFVRLLTMIRKTILNHSSRRRGIVRARFVYATTPHVTVLPARTRMRPSTIRVPLQQPPSYVVKSIHLERGLNTYRLVCTTFYKKVASLLFLYFARPYGTRACKKKY